MDPANSESLVVEFNSPPIRITDDGSQTPLSLLWLAHHICCTSGRLDGSMNVVGNKAEPRREIDGCTFGQGINLQNSFTHWGREMPWPAAVLLLDKLKPKRSVEITQPLNVVGLQNEQFEFGHVRHQSSI